MAKRSRNLPTKKAQKVKDKLFGIKGISTIRIREFEISSNLLFLKSKSVYDKFITNSAATIVILGILCQIKALKPNAKSVQLDQSPSFKFYKKKVLVDSPGQIFALFLALGLPESGGLIPDEDQFQDWVSGMIDGFTGNERVMDNPTYETGPKYIAGQMSRIIGIMNACPATSMQTLGFSSDCQTWKIADLLSRVDNKDIASVPREVIIDLIKGSTMGEPNEEGIYNKIIFNEDPLKGSSTISGCTVLEYEIFGDLFPERTTSKSSKFTESPSKIVESGIHPEAERVLSSYELTQFRGAILIKNNKRIEELYKLVDQRLAQLTPPADQEEKLTIEKDVSESADDSLQEEILEEEWPQSLDASVPNEQIPPVKSKRRQPRSK